MENEADGIVTTMGNMYPEMFLGICHSFQQQVDATYLQKRLSECRQIFDEFPFHAAIKHALYLQGFEQCPVRPPLLNLTIAQKTRLERKLLDFQFHD